MSIKIYTRKPELFLRKRVRPDKATAFMQELEWHLNAARTGRYTLEPFTEERRVNLEGALGYLLGERQRVKVEEIPYSHFATLAEIKPFFVGKAGSSLCDRVTAHFTNRREERYRAWQWRDRLIDRNMEAIFLTPIADAIDDDMPRLHQVDANRDRNMQSLFMENLRCLLICRLVSYSQDVSRGTKRLLMHLLEATRSCLPLCQDMRDDNTFYVLTRGSPC